MKTNNSFHYAIINHRNSSALLLIFLFVFLTGATHAIASGDPPRYRESGELTGVEKNINVVISKRGYPVDPSALVVNAAGKPISLDKLPVPTYVNFEYSYIKTDPKTISPVVVYIEEAKQKRNSGRSQQ